jgi:predicted deacylase
MSQPSMITATVDFEADGLHTGALRVPHSSHRSAYGHIPIPVAVARRGEGPTVVLTGANHGDEYEGPLALIRLIRELDLARLNGRLIVIPALNFPAFLAGSRVSPIDGVNLNRAFPGERNGTVTQMIAHYVETVLMPIADYALDFHSGGSSLNYLPTLLAPRSEDPAERQRLEPLVEAFGAPRVLFMDSGRALSGEDRVIGAAARRNNVFFLTSEMGGAGAVNHEGLAITVEGLAGFLDKVGVLARATPPAPASAPAPAGDRRARPLRLRALQRSVRALFPAWRRAGGGPARRGDPRHRAALARPGARPFRQRRPRLVHPHPRAGRGRRLPGASRARRVSGKALGQRQHGHGPRGACQRIGAPPRRSGH